MNKQAQGTWAYSIMLGLTVIILGMALAPVGQSFINDAMNSTVSDTLGLDCSNSSISNFDKGTCTITDFSVAYFFGGIILVGITLIGAKILIQ